jgi:hypothetical protein
MSNKVTVLKSTLPPAFLKKVLTGGVKFTIGKIVTVTIPDNDKSLVYPKGSPKR